MTTVGLIPRRAPSVVLPLAYLGAAATAFVLAALALPGLGAELAGHYYHPRVLALTHVVALGWITLAIFGASYQLVPVVIERPLWSERVARWQLAAVVAGIAGMVGHFWLGRWEGLAWAAALVGAGTLAHVVNIAMSLRALARWSFTARGLALGMGGLVLTVAFGLVLALSHGRDIFPGGPLSGIHAHFHLALLGWIAPMMLGVSARVYPMFLLAPEPGGPGERLQLWGLRVAIPMIVTGLVADRPALVVPGALAAAAALGAHAAWIVGLIRYRRRPTLDWGLRFVLTGTVCLGPAAVLGLALALDVAGPRAALAYAVLGLGGWVSLTIVGMMLKIVPFLVWYRVYAPRVGRETVPTLAELSAPGVERLAYACLCGGVLALAAAVGAGTPAGVTAAGLLVAVGTLAFASALGRTLLHLRAGAVARHAPSLASRP